MTAHTMHARIAPLAGTTHSARGAVRPAHLVAGVVLLVAAIVAAAAWDTGLSSVLVFALLPDVALLAAIGGGPHQPGQLPRRAVPVYNLLHSPVVPVLLLVAAVGGLGSYWVVAATTWAAHIALDRGVGYGLRSKDGWQRG
jgi:hypothetical protein